MSGAGLPSEKFEIRVQDSAFWPLWALCFLKKVIRPRPESLTRSDGLNAVSIWAGHTFHCKHTAYPDPDLTRIHHLPRVGFAMLCSMEFCVVSRIRRFEVSALFGGLIRTAA